MKLLLKKQGQEKLAYHNLVKKVIKAETKNKMQKDRDLSI